MWWIFIFTFLAGCWWYFMNFLNLEKLLQCIFYFILQLLSRSLAGFFHKYFMFEISYTAYTNLHKKAMCFLAAIVIFDCLYFGFSTLVFYSHENLCICLNLVNCVRIYAIQTQACAYASSRFTHGILLAHRFVILFTKLQ